MKTLYLINVLSFLALGLAAFAIFLRVRKEAHAGSVPGATKERHGSRAMQISGIGQQPNAANLDPIARERRQSKGKR